MTTAAAAEDWTLYFFRTTVELFRRLTDEIEDVERPPLRVDFVWTVIFVADYNG